MSRREVVKIQTLCILGSRYNFYAVNTQEAWGKTPSDKTDGIIQIGVDQEWWKVCDSIVHEVFETLLVLRDKALVVYGEIPADTTCRRWFMFDHSEFTLIASHVGNIICAVMKKYEAEWKRCNRRRISR